ncbi:hypothetical protein C0995_009290, partial [Termitomyces sp. Mi166
FSLQEQKKICIITILPSQSQLPRCAPDRSKGKAKVIEEDDDKEDEATRQQHLELKNFVVPMMLNNWVQKKCPPMEVLELAEHVNMIQATKAFLKSQLSRVPLCLEGFKNKGKSKAIAMEKTGTKHAFKSKEIIVNSDSKEDEEERACVIKKVKHEHVEELVGKEKF